MEWFGLQFCHETDHKNRLDCGLYRDAARRSVGSGLGPVNMPGLRPPQRKRTDGETLLPFRQFLFKTSVEPIAESGGKLEHAIVRDQDHDVTRGVQYGRANLAGLKVVIDLSAQLGVNLAVNVVRDMLPNVFAVDPHCRFTT